MAKRKGRREFGFLVQAGAAAEFLSEVRGAFAAKLPKSPRAERPFLADIEVAVDRFAFQLKMFEKTGLRLPCVALGDAGPAPIDLLPNSMVIPDVDLARCIVPDPPRASAVSVPGPLRASIDLPSVTTAFIGRLSALLEMRLKPAAPAPLMPQLSFTVHTKKHGLRVHYSNTLLLNFDQVFGSPTSPVVGWLRPGVYVFAVQKPGQPEILVDHGEYSVPPHTEAHLTVA